MSTKSTTRRRLSPEAAKYLPRPDFPLSPHLPTRRWYKVILGKRRYFGPLDQPDKALDKYLDEKDDLHAGREPRQVSTGVTVADVVNAFLSAKRQGVENGELGERMWHQYYEAGQLIAHEFGRTRVVADLRPDDFARLRAAMAKRFGHVVLGNTIQRVRSTFKWAADSDLIEHQPKYGPGFRKPPQRAVRKARREAGPKLYEPADIRKMLDAADQPLHTMILLGVNCGMGQTDLAQMRYRDVDLETGILSYPRPKTEIARRAVLWPETVSALREAIEARPEPRDAADADRVFLTRTGRPYVRDRLVFGEDGKPRRSNTDAIALAFTKLTDKLGIKRDGRGFYCFRHVTQTIAEQTRDFPAVELVMGRENTKAVATMYREHIDDDRLKAIADHLKSWLWPE